MLKNLIFRGFKYLLLLVCTMVANLYAAEEAGAGAARWSGGGYNRVEVEGLDWVYNRVGSGEALILVHGFGASKESWDFILPYLKDRYDVIAVDLPGFGESGKPEGIGYGVRAQAERLYRFARHLGLQEWHLAGNSMGGSIAGELAAARPEAIKSLWLIAPAGVRAAHPSEFDQHMAGGGDNVMIPESEADFDRMMDWLYHQAPHIPAPIKAGILARFQENATMAASVHQDLMADWPALEESLRGFSKPTLITWGANDRLVDVTGADALCLSLSSATLDIMRDCGHVPMLERPEDCAARFKLFADRR